MDKREIVEAWLDDLCQRVNESLDDDTEWSQAFRSQVQAAEDRGLLVVVIRICWYFPDDDDVEYLYPIACVARL